MPEDLKSNPLHQLRTDLAARFPERKDVIVGALAAVLAGASALRAWDARYLPTASKTTS